MKILPLLQQAFPTATGFENLITVVQANAEGHLVKIEYKKSEDDCLYRDAVYNHTYNPVTVFVKLVDAVRYSKEKASWTDLRRTLMYCRTEVRFYRDILPALLTSSSSHCTSSSFFVNATPQIFLADYDLEGLLTEDEGVTDNSNIGPLDDKWSAANHKKGGFVIMEGISPDDYFQDSPITMEQAKQTLATIAALHATAWQDKPMLTKAHQNLSRGSYHLKTRNPDELRGMTSAWTHFIDSFRDLDTSGVLEICGVDFGRRIQDLAEYVCQETSPGPMDAYATLSHGDFKAMNCFLPVVGNEASQRRGVVIVDFASIGVGFGMQDVAMHIHHAVRPNDLANGGEMALLDHYLEVLNSLLRQRGLQGEYPREIAMRHYRLAVVDYFRFFLGRFWKSSTPATFAKKASSINTALMNRDIDAAFAFLERVQQYVVQIEIEREQNKVCNDAP